MLSWFVAETYVSQAMNTEILIDDKMVLKNKEYSHPTIGDDLNFNILRKYFTVRGWKAVQRCIDSFLNNPAYSCNGCYKNLGGKGAESTIQCDKCLMWYHWQCVLLRKAPKSTKWFCNYCKVDTNMKKEESAKREKSEF